MPTATKVVTPNTATTPSQANLQANLQSLSISNPALVQQLIDTPPAQAITFHPTDDGVLAGTYLGKALCSHRHPLAEAHRLIDPLNILERAVFVVMGFGMGYHIRRLLERLDSTGVVVVFENDVALLRAVFEEIDHSAWLKDATIVFATDPDDLASLSRSLDSSAAMVGQGVSIVEHPASRNRLGEATARFSTRLREYVANTRTTLLTTLMRSVDTIRNLTMNLDHYVDSPGLTDLRGIAAGYPAVLVSAGPSLYRNLQLLADPAVRERCVIIAVQTTLKPLLIAGIKPHFVTALDYHETSRRFYEGLDARAIEGITLVVEPKVHPAVLDAFPGNIRCCASPYLDKLLGEHARPMGTVPAGATVAHLSLYLARYMGCDPAVLIGQDLGFTDGLYYAPGNAVHDVWAPELNPFNTIEMMEWQRIARHRVHLEERDDASGNPVITDMQMLAYLQQFERDFGRDEERGLTVIDATEGGIRKQHTTAMPLREALDTYAVRTLPEFPEDSDTTAANRSQVRDQLLSVRREVRDLRNISRRTVGLIESMMESQSDRATMHELFKQLDKEKLAVDKRASSFELLNHFNQMGVYRRLRADRRIQLQRTAAPLDKQAAELERDLSNVSWIQDAASDLMGVLEAGARLVDGDSVTVDDLRHTTASSLAGEPDTRTYAVGALIAVSPTHSGGGVSRDLTADLHGRTVLQTTLERVSKSQRLASIVLLVEPETDIESLIDRQCIALPVHVYRSELPLFGLGHRAVQVARAVAPTAWRAGVAGMSAWDEVCAPIPMHQAMLEHELDAGLIIGADWPLLDTSEESGCDAVIRRFLEHPDRHRLVFTQAPPGLGNCLVTRSLMREFCDGHRVATIGSRLVYQPQSPQGDPVSRDANVQIAPEFRNRITRVTFDTEQRIAAIRQGTTPDALARPALTPEQLDRIDEALTAPPYPAHVILELNSTRLHRGLMSRHGYADVHRPDLSMDLAERLFDQLAGCDEIVLTLDGTGDGLLSDSCADVIRLANAAGIAAVNLRTELTASRDRIDAVVAAGVDIMTVDLHADRAATYETMLGSDAFRSVLINIHYLIEHRRRLTDHAASVAFALPWIVPALERRRATVADIRPFFDRWTHLLGAGLVEPPLPDSSNVPPAGEVAPTWPPPQVDARDDRRDLRILSDGSIPLLRDDLRGAGIAGDLRTTPIETVWPEILATRAARR